MEKSASKWLEMRSQIHRFSKHSRGGPRPPKMRRATPSHTPPPPIVVFASPFKTSVFTPPPPSPATTSLGLALNHDKCMAIDS